jgi:hypothetical protein
MESEPMARIEYNTDGPAGWLVYFGPLEVHRYDPHMKACAELLRDQINSAVESREKVLRDRITSLESELSKAKDRPKKVCTVCGDETEYGCADCRISFRTTIFVCGKPSCRDEHEKVCPILIKESPDA